jgi:uncharacterized protein YegP (UPF0339 family)
MKIIIVRNGFFHQKWSFKIIAKNGKILCHSEKYHNFKDVGDAIDIIQKGIQGCEIVNEYKN